MFGALMSGMAASAMTKIAIAIAIGTLAAGLGGCIVDKIGKGAADARELAMKEQVLEDERAIAAAQSERRRAYGEDLAGARARIASLEDQIAAERSALPDVDDIDPEAIPLCPAVCRYSPSS